MNNPSTNCKRKLLQRLQFLQNESQEIVRQLHDIERSESSSLELDNSETIYLDQIDEDNIYPPSKIFQNHLKRLQVFVGEQGNKRYYIVPGRLADDSLSCAQIVNEYWSTLTPDEKVNCTLLIKACGEFQRNGLAPSILKSYYTKNPHSKSMNDYIEKFMATSYVQLNPDHPLANYYTTQFFDSIIDQSNLDMANYLGFCFYEVDKS